MNYAINSVLNKIPRVYRIIACSVVGVAIVLLLWFYGMRAVNGVSSWWFSRQIAAERKQLDETKSLAADLAKQLAVEKAKREAAEKVLADKHLNSEQKLKAYEEAINSPVTPTPVGSTESLCERARNLSVPCEP